MNTSIITDILIAIQTQSEPKSRIPAKTKARGTLKAQLATKEATIGGAVTPAPMKTPPYIIEKMIVDKPI